MPQLSNKIQNLPMSPIRLLEKSAVKAKEQGKKIYHLNIGQPDIPTPQVMMDAARDNTLKVLEYGPSSGITSYRRKLASYYNQRGYNLHEDQILITTGASEAIVLAFMACCDFGEEIIIPEPFYANMNGFAFMGDAHLVPVTSHIEENFALPPIEEFRKKVNKKTKAIFLCSPSNPTGHLYSEKELKEIRELVLEHDLFLFIDEVYRDFIYDDQQYFSAMQLEGLEQNLAVFDSISKKYSACGARIGAILSKNEAFLASIYKMAALRLSAPLLGQMMGEAALSLPDSFTKEIQEEYQQRRDTILEGLGNIEGVQVPQAGGSFHIMVRLPVSDANHFCRWLLEAFDWEGCTVMLAPAEGFYSTPGLGKDQVRIAYVLKEEDLKKAIQILEKALREYAKVQESKKAMAQ